MTLACHTHHITNFNIQYACFILVKNAARQQANADRLEEQQQQQTEGEDLDAQDGMLKMELE